MGYFYFLYLCLIFFPCMTHFVSDIKFIYSLAKVVISYFFYKSLFLIIFIGSSSTFKKLDILNKTRFKIFAKSRWRSEISRNLYLYESFLPKSSRLLRRGILAHHKIFRLLLTTF